MCLVPCQTLEDASSPWCLVVSMLSSSCCDNRTGACQPQTCHRVSVMPLPECLWLTCRWVRLSSRRADGITLKGQVQEGTGMGRQMRGITSQKQFVDSRSQVGPGVLTAVMRAALGGVCLTGCLRGRRTQPPPALRLQRERGAPVRGLASGLPIRWYLSVRPFWGNDRGSLLRNMIDGSLLGHRAGWRKFKSEFGIVNEAYTKYPFFSKTF